MEVSTHVYVKNIQRKAIKAERENAKKEPYYLVLQIDFAKNWSVIHNKAVEGNHWVNDQIYIFTAVSYQGDSRQCNRVKYTGQIIFGEEKNTFISKYSVP